jgi:hypothetical protein
MDRRLINRFARYRDEPGPNAYAVFIPRGPDDVRDANTNTKRDISSTLFVGYFLKTTRMTIYVALRNDFSYNFASSSDDAPGISIAGRAYRLQADGSHGFKSLIGGAPE